MKGGVCRSSATMISTTSNKLVSCEEGGVRVGEDENDPLLARHQETDQDDERRAGSSSLQISLSDALRIVTITHPIDHPSAAGNRTTGQEEEDDDDASIQEFSHHPHHGHISSSTHHDIEDEEHHHLPHKSDLLSILDASAASVMSELTRDSFFLSRSLDESGHIWEIPPTGKSSMTKPLYDDDENDHHEADNKNEDGEHPPNCRGLDIRGSASTVMLEECLTREENRENHCEHHDSGIRSGPQYHQRCKNRCANLLAASSDSKRPRQGSSFSQIAVRSLYADDEDDGEECGQGEDKELYYVQ